jgi:hypothetical protein
VTTEPHQRTAYRKRESREKQERLDLIAKQVKDGTLRVRKASEAERAEWERAKQEREQAKR